VDIAVPPCPAFGPADGVQVFRRVGAAVYTQPCRSRLDGAGDANGDGYADVAEGGF
jgi:hypothetical protein